MYLVYLQNNDEHILNKELKLVIQKNSVEFVQVSLCHEKPHKETLISMTQVA